jgi:hypothetical protein
MLREKLERLNALLVKVPMPQKTQRDLVIIAVFDRICICEANTYEVVLGNEWAKIAIVGFNPVDCHKAYIIESTYFRRVTNTLKPKYNHLPKDNAILIQHEKDNMSRTDVAKKYGVTRECVSRRYSEIRKGR